MENVEAISDKKKHTAETELDTEISKVNRGVYV